MDRITQQSPIQRGYGSTSSPRNDSLKHTQKHKKGRKKSNQEANHSASGGPSGQTGRTVRDGPRGPSGRVPRTVRQGTADCLHPCRGLSGLSCGPSVKANRTSSGEPRKTDRPRGARGLSARYPRTVRPVHADRPKLRPTKTQSLDGSKRMASKNTKNTRRTAPARTVRRPHADRPPLADRTEKRQTSKVNSPKSSSDFPNGRSCGDKGLGT
jgi:hypothetical protein